MFRPKWPFSAAKYYWDQDDWNFEIRSSRCRASGSPAAVGYRLAVVVEAHELALMRFRVQGVVDHATDVRRLVKMKLKRGGGKVTLRPLSVTARLKK
jgi:hypothetical protein